MFENVVPFPMPGGVQIPRTAGDLASGPAAALADGAPAPVPVPAPLPVPALVAAPRGCGCKKGAAGKLIAGAALVALGFGLARLVG